MFWVLKGTIFWTPKPNVKSDGLENIHNLSLIFVFI